ncbi:MAG: PrsW family intramembrane metalloprotease [Anaerolineae bacterium]|nr:PrsW family intramembrane metalloprotease [Anaerolineae bacterium]
MQHRRTLWLIAGILGISVAILLVCLGGLLALLLALSALVFEEPLEVSSALQAAGLIVLGLAIGIPLALEGRAGWREQPPHPFNPSHTRWLWLALVPAFVILTLLGATAGYLPRAIDLQLPSDMISWAQALLLPPVHVLAMSIPPLLALGLVGWGLRGTGGTQRDVVAGMAGGGCLGLGIAMALEVVIIIAVIIVVTMGVILTPGGVDQLYELAQDMEDPNWQADASNIVDLLLSPMIVVSLFGLLCIVVPLIEETFKTLAVGLAGHWIRPHPGRAFLWGVAAGAGFALAENLLNGAAGGVESWAAVAVARVGATAMHCLASGLLGWGWGQLWTARRPLRLLGTFAFAVVIHGLWNGAAVGVAYAGMIAMAQEEATRWISAPGLAAIAIVAMMGLLTISFLAALFLVARRLAHQGQDRLQNSIAIAEAVPYSAPPRAPTL